MALLVTSRISLIVELQEAPVWCTSCAPLTVVAEPLPPDTPPPSPPQPLVLDEVREFGQKPLSKSTKRRLRKKLERDAEKAKAEALSGLEGTLAADKAEEPLAPLKSDKGSLPRFHRAREVVGEGEVTLNDVLEGVVVKKGSLVGTRRYPKCKTTDDYYLFLRRFNHPNLLRPAYKLDDGDYSYFVFEDLPDCTLQDFLDCNSSAVLSAGSDNVQKDFTDTVISIQRQLCGAIHGAHMKGIHCGNLSLGMVYLKFGRKGPKVYLLLPDYDSAAMDGQWLGKRHSKEEDRKKDWWNFGQIILRQCAKSAGMSAANAYEVFDLIDRISSQEVASYADFVLHPAIDFENNKLDFLINSFETVLRTFKDNFFTPRLQFPSSEWFKSNPWTIRFHNLIKDLKDEDRESYCKGREPNNMFNFIRFIRNVLLHIRSHVRLKNQFGDGATFFRYVRVHCPDVFLGLQKAVDAYQSPEITALKLKLQQDWCVSYYTNKIYIHNKKDILAVSVDEKHYWLLNDVPRNSLQFGFFHVIMKLCL